MHIEGVRDVDLVHCRTGSLESDKRSFRLDRSVHCRTGSLENPKGTLPANVGVHCRTGSLEIANTSLMV